MCNNFKIKIVTKSSQTHLGSVASIYNLLGRAANHQLYHNTFYRIVWMTIQCFSITKSVMIRFLFNSQVCNQDDAISYAHLN